MNQTQSDRNYIRAAHTIECARSLAIDVTHQLPPDVPETIIEAWMEIDDALREFAQRLRNAERLGSGASA